MSIAIEIAGAAGAASEPTGGSVSEPSRSVATVTVRVTDRDGQLLASATAPVSSEDVTILSVAVPAGPGRRFIGRALDAHGALLFQGLTIADLVPGSPAAVTIALNPVGIEVLPSTASVLVGATQSFTAAVSGLVDPSVRWSVNDVVGGQTGIGTISQTNPAVYTAPASAPQGPVVVKAAGVSDPSVAGTAVVTIMKADLWVDVATGTDADGCGSEGSPCRSITRGLREATAGKTVQVAPGTYNESVETFPLHLKSGVQVSAGGGAPPLITSSTITGGPAIVGAVNGTLSGVVLDGNGGALNPLVLLESATPTIKNTILRNGTVGIAVRGGTPVVAGNTLSGFTRGGVTIDGAAAPRIEGNAFNENDVALDMRDGAAPRIQGNMVTHNRVGILVRSAGGGGASHNQIRDNQTGVEVEDGGNFNLGDETPGNPGQNVLSCNAQADLETVASLTARANRWDHAPPTTATVPGDGVDIAASAGREVNVAGAAQAAQPCTVVTTRATLTVVKDGAGSGVVASNPSGIACGATCAASFSAGTKITLTATADPGSVFEGWSDGCTGTGTCTIALSGDQTVRARFVPVRDTLAVQLAGSGRVTSDPGGIACPSACEFAYERGTSVTLTAQPDGGAIFTGWGGACAGTGACTVTLAGDATVTAQFIRTFALEVRRDGSGGGAVTSSPEGISCGAACEARYPDGTVVTLTAVPETGSTFSGWSGAGCGGSADCSFVLTGDTVVSATFEPIPYTLTVINDSAFGGGTVTSIPSGIDCGSTCSAPFAYGTVVNLIATPDGGYGFAGWSGGCTGFDTCVVTMTADVTVNAFFYPQIFLKP